MKNFEKWWKNPDNQFWLEDYVSEDNEEFAEMAWKAALEWALKSIHTNDTGQDYIDPWDIEEELEQ